MNTYAKREMLLYCIIFMNMYNTVIDGTLLYGDVKQYKSENIWIIQHWEIRSKLPNTISSQSWKDWLKYAKLQKCWSCSSSCNSITGTGWRWMKMLHQINKPPPMDLLSERLILSLKISPSNNHADPHYNCTLKITQSREGTVLQEKGNVLAK